ncbi:MAG: hypothetical protein KAZ88_04565 [Acidimicrobiia bacterium]|nr:hypothetical protein [Acidimicrobiia bacterium]
MPLADSADELRHRPDENPWWNESVYLDWTDESASNGGYLRIGLLPNQGVAWYWGALVRQGEPTVLLIDHAIALPTRADAWELRSDGLWADYTVEEPLAHASAGLESFALAIDDPADTDADPLVGDRVAFGLELDWTTDAPGLYRWPVAADRTEAPCSVQGEVLLGDERFPINGLGQRDHSWGHRDWYAVEWTWTAFHFPDGRHFHTTTAWLGDEHVSFGYKLENGRYTDIQDASLAHSTPVRPQEAAFVLDGEPMTIEPTGWAPVPIRDGGRHARLDRALARLHTADGTVGVGWWERYHLLHT